MKWLQWLEQLRSLPADAHEWDTILEFIEAVTQLSEEKHQEREASRNMLRLALEDLVTHNGQELDYFALGDVTSWSAAACPLTDVLVLTQQVEQLHECLVKHLALSQQPATTLMEERQRRADLATLEETILQAHTSLCLLYTSPSPRDGLLSRMPSSA